MLNWGLTITFLENSLEDWITKYQQNEKFPEPEIEPGSSLWHGDALPTNFKFSHVSEEMSIQNEMSSEWNEHNNNTEANYVWWRWSGFIVVINANFIKRNYCIFSCNE